jgi:hypothetical protein
LIPEAASGFPREHPHLIVSVFLAGPEMTVEFLSIFVIKRGAPFEFFGNHPNTAWSGDAPFP